MPAVAAFGAEIHRMDAKVVKSSDGDGHGEQIGAVRGKLKADFPLRHLGCGDHAQRGMVIVRENVGEI